MSEQQKNIERLIAKGVKWRSIFEFFLFALIFFLFIGSLSAAYSENKSFYTNSLIIAFICIGLLPACHLKIKSYRQKLTQALEQTDTAKVPKELLKRLDKTTFFVWDFYQEILEIYEIRPKKSK